MLLGRKEEKLPGTQVDILAGIQRESIIRKYNIHFCHRHLQCCFLWFAGQIEYTDKFITVLFTDESIYFIRFIDTS